MLISDITNVIAHNVRKHSAPTLQISEPHIFSTVPDDPIEMPPAVFVQPLLWRKEHAYFVLGLTSSPTPTLLNCHHDRHRNLQTHPDLRARGSASIRLHAPQWKLLLAFDGQRALSEVALSAGIPFAEALPSAENFSSTSGSRSSRSRSSNT